MRTLHVPTLVIWGDRDALIPVSDAQRFVADIPGARVHVYEGLGNVPMEEDGQRTVADVRAFLDGQHDSPVEVRCECARRYDARRVSGHSSTMGSARWNPCRFA